MRALSNGPGKKTRSGSIGLQFGEQVTATIEAEPESVDDASELNGMFRVLAAGVAANAEGPFARLLVSPEKSLQPARDGGVSGGVREGGCVDLRALTRVRVEALEGLPDRSGR